MIIFDEEYFIWKKYQFYVRIHGIKEQSADMYEVWVM